MLKRFLSVILAVTLLFSMAAIAHAENKSDAPTGNDPVEPVLYFDTTTTGWEGFSYIGFHIWSIDDPNFVGHEWGGKKQRGKAGENSVWYYDLGKAGLSFKDECQYAVVFYDNLGRQTYNLLFDTTCFGDTAYADTTNILENPEDSNKTALPTYWRNQDPAVNGPELKISSIGNVVGECMPRNTDAETMFLDFLSNTLNNARLFTEMTDQDIIDNVGEGLGLSADEVYELLSDSDVDTEWSYAKSTLTKDEPIPVVEHTMYFDARSAGWQDSEFIGFHIMGHDEKNPEYQTFGSTKEYGADDDGDGIWEYTISDMYSGYDTEYSADDGDDETEEYTIADNYGNEFWSYWNYTVIFYNDQYECTYPLVFDEDCLDEDTAYCKENTYYAHPDDSSKQLKVAYWKNQDPEDNGPRMMINSTGDVTGESMYDSPEYMLASFLEHGLEKARTLSGKTDQQLIDEIGAKLELTLEEMERFFDYGEFDVDWSAEDSTLESEYDPDKIYVGTDEGYYLVEAEKGDTYIYELYCVSNKPVASLKGTIHFPAEGLKLVDATVLNDSYFEGVVAQDPEDEEAVDFFVSLIYGADYTEDEDIVRRIVDPEVDIEMTLYQVPLVTLSFEVVADSGKYRVGHVLDEACYTDGTQADLYEDYIWGAEYLFSDEPYADILRGDYDKDGDITVMDATRAQRIVAQLDERPDEDFLIWVDADGDEELTVMDATRIQRVIADLCDWDGYKLGSLEEPPFIDEYELPFVSA